MPSLHPRLRRARIGGTELERCCVDTAPISESIKRAVEASFQANEWPIVLGEIRTVWQWGPEYTRRAILVLSFGNLAKLQQLVKLAHEDARDVLLSLEEPPAGVSHAELAKRFQVLGLEVPDVLARYADQH